MTNPIIHGYFADPIGKPSQGRSIYSYRNARAGLIKAVLIAW